ncbi:MAG: hypothetical protein WA821_14975 [Anaerolineales bacterium]
MEPTVETTSKKNNGVGIIFGSMAVLCALVCLCLGGYVYIFRQQIPGVQNYFPTATPTATAPAHQPASGDIVFRDGFSDNKNQWYVCCTEITPSSSFEISNGKLRLASIRQGRESDIYCRFCPALKSPYYFQVELSTDRPTKDAYGMGFSSDEGHDIFYLFEINTDPPQYELYKFRYQTWAMYISRKTDLIKPYPNTNTLGVSLDHDLITLYINGQIVDTYEDTGNVLGSGTFWPHTDDVGPTVVVDNLYAYGK